MKLKVIQGLLHADLLSGTEGQLETDIASACGSDLMSDVLAFGRSGQLLLTGLTNAQSIRTAHIIEAKALTYVRGKRPNDEALELATLMGIPVLSTRYMMYEACGILYRNGLPGVGRPDPQGPPPPEIRDASDFHRSYEITGRNFSHAGSVSTSVKDVLEDIGIPPAIIRRVAIAAYEAEMNIVLYAEQGAMTLVVTPDLIRLQLRDQGPGIPDIGLAMQEGYSTATPEMREMGFGAGMGLPNIQKNADRFEITSDVGKGTRLEISFDLPPSKTGAA
jgi:serine/threonine-protein kinase RsbT